MDLYTFTGDYTEEHMDLESVITQSTIGVALIVSNDYTTNQCERNLPETHTDAKMMTKFFEKCKYKVFQYRNLSEDKFIKLYEKMAKHKYPKTCRRLVVYFSGHGSDGIMLSQYGEKVDINNMVTSFKPVNGKVKNETLGNMVRMFFIDACRGTQEEYGYLSSKHATPTIKHIAKLKKDSSNDTNILVAYATTPQHVCYINEEKEMVVYGHTTYLKN